MEATIKPHTHTRIHQKEQNKSPPYDQWEHRKVSIESTSPFSWQIYTHHNHQIVNSHDWPSFCLIVCLKLLLLLLLLLSSFRDFLIHLTCKLNYTSKKNWNEFNIKGKPKCEYEWILIYQTYHSIYKQIELAAILQLNRQRASTFLVDIPTTTENVKHMGRWLMALSTKL